jgi:hypothetical protein
MTTTMDGLLNSAPPRLGKLEGWVVAVAITSPVTRPDAATGHLWAPDLRAG